MTFCLVGLETYVAFSFFPKFFKKQRHLGWAGSEEEEGRLQGDSERLVLAQRLPFQSAAMSLEEMPQVTLFLLHAGGAKVPVPLRQPQPQLS